MKIKTEKNVIKLFPENSYDYYKLGILSKKIPHTVSMSSDTDNPHVEINEFEITNNSLLGFLIRAEL